MQYPYSIFTKINNNMLFSETIYRLLGLKTFWLLGPNHDGACGWYLNKQGTNATFFRESVFIP